MCFEFLCILIGKSTMVFLTDQSWRVLKPWYTGEGPEQGFRLCFTDGLNQRLVSSVVQAILPYGKRNANRPSMMKRSYPRATGGHFVFACVNMNCWSATEAFSVNCLRSVPAFAGCFLELNDVYWVLHSTNMFFKVSRYFYDESEFIVASLSPLRGQSFLS